MIKEKNFEINQESLEKAIKEFNETKLIAALVFNMKTNEFDVEAFHNGVDRVSTVIIGDSIVLFEKEQFEEQMTIGEKELSVIMRRLKELQKGYTLDEICASGNWY